MRDPVVMGHPLHAMLASLPIGITIAGVAFDIIGLFSFLCYSKGSFFFTETVEKGADEILESVKESGCGALA